MHLHISFSATFRDPMFTFLLNPIACPCRMLPQATEDTDLRYTLPCNRQPKQQKLQSSGIAPTHFTASGDHRTGKMMQFGRVLLPPLSTYQQIN